MQSLKSIASVFCALGLLCVCGTSQGANLTTTIVQGGGQYWTAAIWLTNGTGTTASPVPGNTYECVPNGTAVGNNQNETRIRNPYAAGQAAVQTFPGDSLTLNTNTEIRFKQIAAGNVPICNFPGVGSNPGLILKGGMLNAGDDAIFTLTGRIRVDSQSYICPGNNDGANAVAGRAFNIAAQLSGSGTMVIFEGATNNAQQISGTSNTFNGQWIVKAGLLLGSGANSLGTNSITLDPAYPLPVPPFSETAPVVEVTGPAVLEPGYDLNSAGTLTLINGGMMRLHQNCFFTAVNIEGTFLSPGKHTYAELVANYPNNFAAGGAGSITVQPYVTVVPPGILTQPLPQSVYAGRTARFTVTASGPAPLSFQWRKGGANLSDGNNISGATTATLTLSNVSASDVASYDVVVSNPGGVATSSGATLSLATASGEAYETALLAAAPVALYRLNETGAPASGAYAFDYIGGYVGTYGTAVANGIAGPRPAGFPGFGAANNAAQFVHGTGAARITLTPWNLNTNAVTILAWINPAGTQVGFNGIVFCRGGGTGAGLNYSGSTDVNGNYTLGYTWNNQWETWSWDSGLVAPVGQWSLVALVVTPTNATIHLMNADGLVASTHPWNHVIQSFSGTTLIGDDSNDNGNGSRVFDGSIDEVAVFNSALSPGQIAALYSAASGVSSFAPRIAMQPVSQTPYAGQTVRLTVAAGGSEPLTYQWKKGAIGSGIYANVSDNSRISGSSTPTLIINNVSDADAADYVVTVANAINSVTSSPATLTVQGVSAAEQITMSVQQAAGTDWDNGSDWSDGFPASDSAAFKPGSTYELLPGARMRSPVNPSLARFPGNVLILQGDAVWSNNPAAGNTTISEIRLKQPNPGTVVFKKLVMNGGQLDVGNDGVAVVDGQIDVLTNAPFYNDGATDRGYRIDAWLTGAGSIEYHGYNQGAYNPNYVHNLNIAGTSNTFSGKWDVVLGTLLGTGSNSLGTNDITVGANGALETTYDVNNPNGNLFLNGRMLLHQNDTFRTVFINGVPLASGTYSFAQLSSVYSNNFPVTWTPQIGATNFSTGSGSITVLVQPAPSIVQQPASLSVYPGQTVQLAVTAQGTPPLYYRWRKGGVNLNDSGNLSGSATNSLTITSVVAANAGNYDLVITNSVGSVTSVVATVNVLPTGPAINITMSVQQAQNNDWNTGADWSDGKPASTSAFSNPGSTYDILPGARMRTPAGAADSTFPGDVVTVNGDGVWLDGSTTAGEIRFKHGNPSVVHFKKLVMNGGQLDQGDNGVVAIAGEMHVLANNSLYTDSGAGQDRPWRIDAWLTGTGTLEYHAYDSSFTGDLNITGTSNTFSGKWHVVQGLLLGTGPNSLGPNDITIEASGALETTYNINNPQGTLFLDGQMFLHQNDLFRKVVIGGVELADGTYTFAQLSATYPTYFPASWTPHLGAEAFSTGSGSITVQSNAPPTVSVQAQLSGSNLKLNWSEGILLEADDLTGPWKTNNATSGVVITPTGTKKFYRIQVR